MSGIIIPRRNFLIGLAATLAAPAVVRASSLMPIRVPAPMRRCTLYVATSGYDGWPGTAARPFRTIQHALEMACRDMDLGVTTIHVGPGHW
jgi:hypothetical protein